MDGPMKNISIPQKLAVAFLIIAVVLCGVAGFSAVQIGKMNTAIDYVSNDLMPKTVAAQKIDTATSDFRIAEVQHILATQSADMTAAEQKISTAQGIVDKNFSVLDRTIIRPEARQLLTAFRQKWISYLEQHQKLIALSRLNRNEEAIAIMRGRSQVLFDELSDRISVLVSFEMKLAAQQRQDAAELHTHVVTLLALVVVMACAALIGILLMLVRQIARPVDQVTFGLTALASGDMSVTSLDHERQDEVGRLAGALNNLRGQLLAADEAKAAQTTLIVESIGRGLGALADGDLTARIETDLTGSFAKLRTDFNHALSAMNDAMAAVTDATSGINNGASDIRQASDDLSQRTEQQAASLEETAAAMHEITETVRETAVNAKRANQVVTETRNDADQSADVVRQAVAAMHGIERSSNEISEIISVIDGIAFQTNLLALNAGVEAARAGDAGKGFAVVASEVRALAQRSADAARDVKERITASSQQVDAGVQLVEQAGNALTRITGRIGEINTLVSDIASAAAQQASGLQQVNTAVAEMDGVTQQNAAMVEEATAAARSLSTEADELLRQVRRFKVANGRSVAPAVHELQQRAATAGRVIATSASARHAGKAALTVVQDGWSEF
jgi:methyl-accepting chemotaxis protein